MHLLYTACVVVISLLSLCENLITSRPQHTIILMIVDMYTRDTHRLTNGDCAKLSKGCRAHVQADRATDERHLKASTLIQFLASCSLCPHFDAIKTRRCALGLCKLFGCSSIITPTVTPLQGSSARQCVCIIRQNMRRHTHTKDDNQSACVYIQGSHRMCCKKFQLTQRLRNFPSFHLRLLPPGIPVFHVCLDMCLWHPDPHSVTPHPRKCVPKYAIEWNVTRAPGPKIHSANIYLGCQIRARPLPPPPHVPVHSSLIVLKFVIGPVWRRVMVAFSRRHHLSDLLLESRSMQI